MTIVSVLEVYTVVQPNNALNTDIYFTNYKFASINI